MKKIILYIVLLGLACSCVDNSEDNPNRRTNSGFVAFDYTMQVIRNYQGVFSYVYQLNEYCLQTTVSKRDSVDQLFDFV